MSFVHPTEDARLDVFPGPGRGGVAGEAVILTFGHGAGVLGDLYGSAVVHGRAVGVVDGGELGAGREADIAV